MLSVNKSSLKQLNKEKKAEKKYTILIVDDELANIESITMVLEGEYNIIKAKDGFEGIKILENHLNKLKVNLIISDQRMPGLSGVEFLKRTISIIPDAVRIILTGYMDVNDVIDAINEGQIYKFLTKPIEPNELLISAKRALEAYELRRQNMQLIDQLQEMNRNLEKKVIERTCQLQESIQDLKKQKEELEYLVNYKIKMEKAILESEEKYRTVFETTGSATVIIEEGTKISLANAEFCKISGFSPEEVNGIKDISEFVVGEDFARMQEYNRIRLTNPKEVPRNYEFHFVDRQGNIKEMLMTVAVIPETKKTVATMMDITERKRMEREISRLDQLNLIGEMAAGIGHEIRNPMTTVRGFLQICRSKEECEPYMEYFDLMVEELDRANSIITEFLSMAKNKTVNLKAQNLNYIVKALYPLIQAGALNSDKNINLDLAEIPDILLDEKEIRQMILNLVWNGLEAMMPGGILTIKTFIEGDRIVLSVQDQGMGISTANLEKIGTPFFTTKDTGTGLGLSVCYSIAARHNALIDFQTGLNGTTFLVRFKRRDN